MRRIVGAHIAVLERVSTKARAAVRNADITAERTRVLARARIAEAEADLICRPTCGRRGHGPEDDDRLLFGTNLCPPQPLLVSLQSFLRRAELIHAIDGPFWQQMDLRSLISVLARRVGEVADRSVPFMPEVPDPLHRRGRR
jgi:hypothetical protein